MANAAAVAPTYDKAALMDAAGRMTRELATDAFATRVRESVERRVVASGDMLLDEVERVQVAVYGEWGFDGAEMLRQMKLVVKTFPGPDTERAITSLCEVEERLILRLNNEFGAKAGQHQQHQHQQQQQQQQQHGHSHGGAPCHGHGHSHGHDHGHSHGGVPCHGHGHGHGGPMMSQQQAMAMQLAMQSLSPQQQADALRIRQGMMQGRAPSADDTSKMQAIQQHLVAYMATMQQVLGASSGPSGGAPK